MQSTDKIIEQHRLLVEAIDFFSQSLHLEQLIRYGYDLVHTTLALEASVLFIKENNQYIMQDQKGYGDVTGFQLDYQESHKAIATRIGRIITEDFDKFFGKKFVETFKVELIIPIIVKDELVGFIASSGNLEHTYDEATNVFSFAMNQLMNKAYENAEAFTLLEEKNYQLDKKIFNLFFINHCSKMLLSELDVDQLYHLSVDIIRELTASGITTFYAYSDTTQKMVLKGYKNILDFDHLYSEIKVLKPNFKITQTVLHIEKDQDILSVLFDGLDEFKRMEAEYVILIIKDKPIGLLTVSKPVNHQAYDASVFELIESVTNSITIAMNNAAYFNQIIKQKNELDQQINDLEQLNKAIKNINSCESVEEVCEITLSTLVHAFEVESCALFMQENNHWVVMDQRGYTQALPSLDDMLNPPDYPIFTYTSNDYESYVFEPYHAYFDQSNCFSLMPIEIDRLSFEGENRVAYLLVTAFKHPVKTTDSILLSAISNAIAPTLLHMHELKVVKDRMVEDPISKLKEMIDDAAKHLQVFDLAYEVYYKRIDDHPLRPTPLGEYAVAIGSHLFALAFEEKLKGYDHVFTGGATEDTLAEIEAWFDHKKRDV